MIDKKTLWLGTRRNMKLSNFLPKENRLGNQYENFLKLKEALEKEGMPENIATYKASYTLEPSKLKKIQMFASKKGEHNSKAVVFFFNSEEEIDLISKYFNVSILNGKEPQIGHSDLLIELLKEMDKL